MDWTIFNKIYGIMGSNMLCRFEQLYSRRFERFISHSPTSFSERVISILGIHTEPPLSYPLTLKPLGLTLYRDIPSETICQNLY
jgi:hypothetical protein